MFDTLDAALTASRAVSQGGKKVLLLRRGLYLLGHRGGLKLGRLDSNTYLLAFPGEVPVLSGGVMVSPHWRPRRCPGEGGGGGGGGGGSRCWRAQIRSQLPTGKEESAGFTFNQLFLADTDTDTDAPDRFSKRAIRARHPNGNPETSGLHTNPSGYMPANSARWLPEIDSPPAREVSIPRQSLYYMLYYILYYISSLLHVYYILHHFTTSFLHTTSLYYMFTTCYITLLHSTLLYYYYILYTRCTYAGFERLPCFPISRWGWGWGWGAAACLFVCVCVCVVLCVCVCAGVCVCVCVYILYIYI